ncbi:MAG: hypothetical protein V1774_02875 [Candidatus Eisenbacteria bacterium]
MRPGAFAAGVNSGVVGTPPPRGSTGPTRRAGGGTAADAALAFTSVSLSSGAWGRRGSVQTAAAGSATGGRAAGRRGGAGRATGWLSAAMTAVCWAGSREPRARPPPLKRWRISSATSALTAAAWLVIDGSISRTTSSTASLVTRSSRAS